MPDISIPDPVTLTLKRESFHTIVVALNELPRKFSQPVFDEILPQLQPVQPKLKAVE